MSHPARSLNYSARHQVVERVASCYHEVSSAQKGQLLDTLVTVTGYTRKYAIGLLNQPSHEKQTIQCPRQPQYGPEVQQALALAWKVTNRICAKRLIPFLPTLVEALERHGHLQLTQENRRKLLSMSRATAERLLHSLRNATPRGLCTTKAGTWLKHQIPIRTFHQWDDARPGFLEADLVAHGGGHSEGCFLSTLTLTDIATGWTECLPLLSKSPEAVLTAFQQARVLFPFPILGLDVDTGGEFINAPLVAYCEQEQITFTRGRPDLKNDQCFVEQKNGAIVRQFVGFDRFAGYQASRQLRELYRALRLYVNCFQPSMKLVSKHDEGEKVRRVYDPAKTPLQRLLLSGILPAATQQYLRKVAQALDPLSLFHQLEHVQQALWRSAVSTSPLTQCVPAPSILPFGVERCLEGALSCEERASASGRQTLPGEPPSGTGLLDWHRTIRDPFEGEWERILSWVLAHPEWSGSDLFQELQHLFPGRYRSSQLCTLQYGLRKIRARLLEIVEVPWPEEMIQASMLTPIEPEDEQQEPKLPTDPVCSPVASASKVQAGARMVLHQLVKKEEAALPRGGERPMTDERMQQRGDEGSQHAQALEVQRFTMTIEEAIQAYLQEQGEDGRSHKTMEWHQTSLGLLQEYLVSQRHLCFLSQITESEVRGWVAFLHTTPSATGTLRRASTIATYARSARAFCYWLVRNGYLVHTPFAKGTMPKEGKKSICLIEPDEFDRLLLACRAGRDGSCSVDQTATRNRAILWVLRDTGIRVSELCGLRLGDVDCEQGTLRIEGRGKARGVTLSTNGRYQLLSYLEQHRLREVSSQEGHVEEDHLFLSETYQPLTSNAITLLFDRLKKRAGMSETRVSPSALRDTFAVRSLQTGGKPEALCEILGLTHMTAIKRYQRLIDQPTGSEQQKEPTQEHQSRQEPGPHKSRRRRRRSSSEATKKRTQ